MSDLTPVGAIASFAGSTISALNHVADKSVVSIDPQGQVEAYEFILGQDFPVDLYNLATAPRKDVVTCQILVKAAATDPVTAWQQVRDGVRALQGLPETGTLVVYADTSATGTVSASARRKRFPVQFTQKNTFSYVVTMTFTLTSDWA